MLFTKQKKIHLVILLNIINRIILLSLNIELLDNFTLKTELTNFNYYSTKEDAKKNIFEYIEVFYNRRRLYSYLNYFSPEKFEIKFINKFNSNVT